MQLVILLMWKRDMSILLDLPEANALKFKLTDGAWFAIRPSGTEPKIKFYFGVKAETKVESDELLLNSKRRCYGNCRKNHS